MTTFDVSTLPAIDGEPEVRRQPLPAAGDDGLLVRVELARVCATDLHIAQGHVPGYAYPSTLGGFGNKEVPRCPATGGRSRRQR